MKPLTCWWHQREVQGNSRVIRVHPLETMHICTKFNPSNVNLMVALKQKSQGSWTTAGFIFLGPWTSVCNFLTIHPIVGWQLQNVKIIFQRKDDNFRVFSIVGFEKQTWMDYCWTEQFIHDFSGWKESDRFHWNLFRAIETHTMSKLSVRTQASPPLVPKSLGLDIFFSNHICHSQKQQLLSSASSSTKCFVYASIGLDRILRQTMRLQHVLHCSDPPARLHFPCRLSDRSLNLIGIVLFKWVRHPICVTEMLEAVVLLSTTMEIHNITLYYIIKARQQARPWLYNMRAKILCVLKGNGTIVKVKCR